MTYTEYLLSLATHNQALMERFLSSLDKFGFWTVGRLILRKAWIPQFWSDFYLPQMLLLCCSALKQDRSRAEMTQLWVSDGFEKEGGVGWKRTLTHWVWRMDPAELVGNQSAPPANSLPLYFWLKYVLCFADIYQSEKCWFLNQSFLSLGTVERKGWGLFTLFPFLYHCCQQLF